MKNQKKEEPKEEQKPELKQFRVTALGVCTVLASDEAEACEKAENGEFVETEHSYITGWEFEQYDAEPVED